MSAAIDVLHALVSQYTAFRCPEDLLELVKAKAKKHRRSLSNYLVCLIEKDTEGMELPPVKSKPVRKIK